MIGLKRSGALFARSTVFTSNVLYASANERLRGKLGLAFGEVAKEEPHALRGGSSQEA